MRFPIKLHADTVHCTELNLLHYKQILKIIYGDEPSKDIFVETIAELLASISDKPQSYFKELDVIQLMVVLIALRIQSMGDSTTVNLKQEKEQTSLELRLDWIVEELIEFCSSFLEFKIEHSSFDIILSPPSLTRLQEKVEDEYLYFIKGVFIKTNNTYVPMIDNNCAKAFFEKLPAKTAASIIGYFETFVSSLKQVNFLLRYGITDQILMFIPSIDSVIWFLKLMFNESIDSFYDNTFYLSYYGHMSGNFLQTCTPGEYVYFAKKLQEVLSQQKGTVQADEPTHGNDNLPEDLQDEDE
jgi:hypothetical protein